MKEIIYYTHNELDEKINTIVQKQLSSIGLSIISVSLKPINFGNNIVLNLKPNAITMTKQILSGLEKSKADIIFFCEHDVLYHKSHFDFIPLRNDLFYYNTNNWRWEYPNDKLITYDHLKSLSGLCADRQLLLNHYKQRLELMKEKQLGEEKDPHWMRKMGYEPGTKSKKRGGSFDLAFEEWKSEYPNIDIRHGKTLTPSKTNITTYKHQPTGWNQTNLDSIPDWKLKVLFNL